MNDIAPPYSPRRFRYAWQLSKVFRAERNGRFGDALLFLSDANAIMALRTSDRVYRADLLLAAQRICEAHAAFALLREEFKGSDDPNRQYLRRYCTRQLSLLSAASGQWSYEAKQAKLIDCEASLKRRFPMATVDEIDEAIERRR